MSADAKHHPYHLVALSPWPVVGGVSSLVLALGALALMAEKGPWLLMVGVVGVAYTMFVWWRDVIAEAGSGDHTPVVQLHLRYGMLLFILSEVMFFAAWFWAYFDVSLFPDTAANIDRVAITGGVWPPKAIHTFDPWGIPLLNTLVLLTSGATVTWAHHALLEGDREGLKRGLLATVILGVSFTMLQAYEYGHAAFDFAGHIYGSTFFMATGFHGAHVIIGTMFLLVCLFRAQKGAFTSEHHFGLEAAIWYWHFVDVVWLFLFSCIYVWGAGPSGGS